MPRYIPDIKNGSKVVIPRSDFSPLDGEKLRELVEDLITKGCEITVIAVDALYRHNMDLDKAMNEGERFLEENRETLIPTKKFRWNDYVKYKEKEIEKNQRLILDKVNAKTKLYYQMVESHEQCRASPDLQSSLNFQSEEYSIYLTFSEFDYCISPEQITSGMHQLYMEFPHIKLPMHVHVKFPIYQSEMLDLYSVFSTKNYNLPNACVLKTLLVNMQDVLFNQEISKKEKSIFCKQVKNIVSLFRTGNDNVSVLNSDIEQLVEEATVLLRNGGALNLIMTNIPIALCSGLAVPHEKELFVEQLENVIDNYFKFEESYSKADSNFFKDVKSNSNRKNINTNKMQQKGQHSIKLSPTVRTGLSMIEAILGDSEVSNSVKKDIFKGILELSKFYEAEIQQSTSDNNANLNNNLLNKH